MSCPFRTDLLRDNAASGVIRDTVRSVIRDAVRSVIRDTVSSVIRGTVRRLRREFRPFAMVTSFRVAGLTVIYIHWQNKCTSFPGPVFTEFTNF